MRILWCMLAIGWVLECLSNIIVFTELLTDEIYGWMLMTTDNPKIYSAARMMFSLNFDMYEWMTCTISFVTLYISLKE